MRGLPQTAWMVQDQRKLETSVHELIADQVQEVTKATGIVPLFFSGIIGFVVVFIYYLKQNADTTGSHEQ